MGIRDELGKDLDAGGAGGGLQTVTATVIDVTDSGTVNLSMQGGEIYDVACTDAYRNRRAGDTVAVRRGAVPVVLWRIGPDPADTEQTDVEGIAVQAARDVQVVRAATYGTGAPAGSGWQAASATYVRKVDGRLELYFQVGSVADPSPPAPGVPTPRPVTVTPTDFGSWRNGRPDTYANYPMQGDWTGGGNRRGAFFYGTKIADACAGKTVTRMEVTLTRRTGSGVNASRPVHLYLHGYTSAPSGQLNLGDGPETLMSLSVGAKRTAALPAAWRTALASGSARGLAIYATGSRDYMSLSGGSIKITFS
ncbi:hypothetical protein [Streptomyces sp. DHE17-7]|uniref:hypothetical protein n=1 Tax=Streptomyces sp. DHE17-7 TaxID=2759949 RepID=UPI0022EB3B33|nr:hypothetical protein [Streptomyces sp. DHE17-7]MBJ6623639.1 hypothetical protein [Streptomyces sp. DHE17-7]